MPYDYDLFSNKDRDYNWGYDGQHKDNFDKFGAPAWNNKTNVYSSYSDDTYKKMLGTVNLDLHYKRSDGNWVASSTSRSNQAIGTYYFQSNKTGWVPCIGFETTYLKNWKQIYDPNTSEVGKFEKDKHGSETGYSNRAVIHDNHNDLYYIGLSGGFPLIEMKKDEQLTYDIEFKDKSKNYVLWVSKRPFDLTGHPDDDSNCIELEGVNKASGCNKGYSIVEGKATIKTQKMADDCYLYLKWGINAATKADIGGGILIPAKTGQVTSE